jgi:hypothetical protein
MGEPLGAGIDVREKKKGKGHSGALISISRIETRADNGTLQLSVRARLIQPRSLPLREVDRVFDPYCDTYKPNHKVGGLDRKKRKIYRRTPVVSSNSV